MFKIFKIWRVLAITSCVVLTFQGVHAQTRPPSQQDPVDLTADALEHDEKMQIVTASGDVMMVQDGRILRADQIVYNLGTDTVSARGNVVLNEANGDVHFSDEVQFNDKLKSGFVEGLKTLLVDGSRFSAKKGRRKNGDTTTMETATYTPCAECERDPQRAPVWQIKASKVTHHEAESTISYNNARFEAFGIPIFYVPYFSHADGSIKRKSGLLSPLAGYKSDLGGFIGSRYYFDIAPDKDATLGAIAMTQSAPLFFGQWRQRWDEAYLELNAGGTYAKRFDQRAGVQVRQNKEARGHIIGQGLWNINDKWRAGLDAAWTSDDQYLRQYDFDELGVPDEDVLESQIYAERFSGRNYAVGRLITFQDVRVREERVEQPEVLPEITASFMGEPGAVPLIKGRWSFDASFLGLEREGGDQDMNRLSLRAGWGRHLVSQYGLVSDINVSMRSDAYNTRDREVALSVIGLDDSTNETRFFPYIHMKNSYPMVKAMEKAQATIEPVVALTFAPNIDVNDDIPNEDSQDVQIDASNLFEANRFPGYDRVEDQSKVTYGVRTGLSGYDGSRAEVFVGQSYRFNDDDNPFPEGSGLNKQSSDIVGQISGQYKHNFGVDYRFQLDSQSLSSQRHEIDAYANWDRFNVASRYLFADALEGTDIAQRREQLQMSGGYYFSEDWRLRAGATHDFGDKPGLRKGSVGLDYFGQCVSFSLTGERNFTDDSSGDSDTEILFRLGLKNIGEFAKSDLRARGASAYP